MSPNVAAAARSLPFDAALYTWIDLGDITTEQVEGRREKLRALGLDPDQERTSLEVNFPFEHFAVILPTAEEYFDPVNVGQVLTIDRDIETKVTRMLGWRYGSEDSVFSLTITPDEKKGYPNELSHITYHKQIPAARLRRDQIEYLYNSTFSYLIAHMTCFSTGIYGDTREGYACRGDAVVNAKRRKKHKKPFYEWTTVVVNHAPRAESKGGTHASPRQHEVRGHYARSRLGKMFWRKAHKRGDPSLGVVFHDYTVKQGEAQHV